MVKYFLGDASIIENTILDIREIDNKSEPIYYNTLSPKENAVNNFVYPGYQFSDCICFSSFRRQFKEHLSLYPDTSVYYIVSPVNGGDIKEAIEFINRSNLIRVTTFDIQLKKYLSKYTLALKIDINTSDLIIKIIATYYILIFLRLFTHDETFLDPKYLSKDIHLSYRQCIWKVYNVFFSGNYTINERKERINKLDGTKDFLNGSFNMNHFFIDRYTMSYNSDLSKRGSKISITVDDDVFLKLMSKECFNGILEKINDVHEEPLEIGTSKITIFLFERLQEMDKKNA